MSVYRVNYYLGTFHLWKLRFLNDSQGKTVVSREKELTPFPILQIKAHIYLTPAFINGVVTCQSTTRRWNCELFNCNNNKFGQLLQIHMSSRASVTISFAITYYTGNS